MLDPSRLPSESDISVRASRLTVKVALRLPGPGRALLPQASHSAGEVPAIWTERRVEWMLRREELIWPNGIGVDYLLDRLVRQALIELNRHN
jgi:hypothetical protein